MSLNILKDKDQQFVNHLPAGCAHEKRFKIAQELASKAVAATLRQRHLVKVGELFEGTAQLAMALSHYATCHRF
ncbi:MAG: hypothetical protein IPK53_03940 [bacterium]|nr:hypothetical protein [bacterium]